jgi:hypothetical protein
LNIKDSLKIIYLMDLEHWRLMENFMKGNFHEGWKMGRVSIHGKMEPIIKANLRMIWGMVKAIISLVKENIKACGKMTKGVEMGI